MKDLPPPAKAKHLLFLFAVYYLVIILAGVFGDLSTVIASAVLGLSLLLLYFTMASYQLMADTLRLTTYDVTVRLRPFVSAKEVNAIDLSPPQGTSPYKIAGISIPVQNTGVIPANQIKVYSYFKHSDTDEIIAQTEEHLPSLAPNVSLNGYWDLRKDARLQQLLRDHTVNLQLLIIYNGQIDLPYISLQTYNIQDSQLPSKPPAIMFEPIQPTCFS